MCHIFELYPAFEPFAFFEHYTHENDSINSHVWQLLTEKSIQSCLPLGNSIERVLPWITIRVDLFWLATR